MHVAFYLLFAEFLGLNQKFCLTSIYTLKLVLFSLLIKFPDISMSSSDLEAVSRWQASRFDLK